MRLQSFWHFDKITFFTLDYCLLVGAIISAHMISPRFAEPVFVDGHLNTALYRIVFGMSLLMACGLKIAGLHRNRAGFVGIEALTRTFAGLLLGLSLFVIFYYFTYYVLVGRIVLLSSLLYGTFFIAGSRMTIWKLAARTSKNILIYGSTQAREHLLKLISSECLPAVVKEYAMPEIHKHKTCIDGPLQQLPEYCLNNSIEEIVVETPDRLTADERAALLSCTGSGINVVHLNYFFERHLERVYVTGLREEWFWGYDPAQRHPIYSIFKRLTDVAVSLVVGGAFAVLLPLIALLIKLQDRGPVFYSQMRVGLSNKLFRIYKLRTMRINAEGNGAQWAVSGDNRVTFLGKFLRKSRLDEAPQFWNILRGDMSLIGPRPERPEMVVQIEGVVPYYCYRHLIKPGLTGWAQINFQYGASIDDAAQKLSYDLYYLKYSSISLDLMIIMRTAAEAMKGAR